MRLDLATLVVRDYDTAVEFFVGSLGFDLVEDSPAVTDTGSAKRWVVVRPAGSETGLLLARAEGVAQAAVTGAQTGGRVAFFLRVDDFDAAHGRMIEAGVRFAEAPRDEPYGRVAVFSDCEGNRWDLIGPA